MHRWARVELRLGNAVVSTVVTRHGVLVLFGANSLTMASNCVAISASARPERSAERRLMRCVAFVGCVSCRTIVIVVPVPWIAASRAWMTRSSQRAFVGLGSWLTSFRAAFLFRFGRHARRRPSTQRQKCQSSWKIEGLDRWTGADDLVFSGRSSVLRTPVCGSLVSTHASQMCFT